MHYPPEHESFAALITMTRIEHFNMTVPDIDAAIRFIQVAAPDYKVRKNSHSPEGYRWVHIGNEDNYIALQEPYPGMDPEQPHERYKNIGVNHVAMVVDDVSTVERNLLDAGFKKNPHEVSEKYRKRVYFYDESGFEWEFLEYFSDLPHERYFYE